MANVVGLINLHSDVSLKGLTERRPVASVSFLGRYGVIDFVLSNFSNSRIDKVGILVKEKPRSLLKHIGSGNAWNFNSKRGGISLLYDEKYANSNMYNHDINNMLENIAISAKQKGIKNIDTKVDAAYQNMHALQKEIEQLKNQIFALKSNEWVNETVSLGSVNALIKKVEGMDAGALKDIVSNLKAKDPNIVWVFGNVSSDKVVFVSGDGRGAV